MSTSAVQSASTMFPTLRPMSTSSSSSSSSSSKSGTDLGATFLNLLSQELQNQDPTNPVDSTAMVGQMISLNQLDQLISINQTLGKAATNTTGKAGTQGSGTTADKQTAAPAATPAASAAPVTAASLANQLPFDPNTLMPLNFNNPAATAASLGASSTNAVSNLAGSRQ